MNIKNTIKFDSIDQAVLLLRTLAKSLEEYNIFSYEFQSQEAYVDVEGNLDAILEFSTNSFSLTFNWDGQSVDVDATEAKTMPSPQVVKPENIQPQVTPKVVEQIVETPKIEANLEPSKQEELVSASGEVVLRNLPDRTLLNTTTLSYEGGYWTPSFSLKENSMWSQIKIDKELDNRKWVSQDDTSLSELTTTTQTRKSVDDSDEDLFSDLDALTGDEKAKMKERKVDEDDFVIRRETHQKASIPAAASFKIPSATKVLQHNEQASQWKEPTKDSVGTDDEWVKPSEVLVEKSKKIPKVSSIPAPNRSERHQGIPEQDEFSTIDPARYNRKGTKSNSDKKEEEISSGDDWVKPSEFLKSKKIPTKMSAPPKAPPTSKKDVEEQEEEVVDDDKINRPPPEAPDKKDEKKKKGWSSW